MQCAPANHNIGLSHATLLSRRRRKWIMARTTYKCKKSRLRCDMYANKRSSFQAKHNPSPRSARSSFSGLNKKLFSSSILPFHSAVRTANDVFLDTSCTGRARARSGSNVGPATGVSYSRRDREDPSPSLFSISQIQLQKRCLFRCHSIQTRCILVSSKCVMSPFTSGSYTYS